MRDGPGFFATRVFAAYLDEAVAMASEGIAVESIEAAAIANGRALGPLAMLDETGVALNLSQARQARADGLEPRFCRPLAEPTLAALVAAGRSGRRAGGGFFDWPSDGPRNALAGLKRPLLRSAHAARAGGNSIEAPRRRGARGPALPGGGRHPQAPTTPTRPRSSDSDFRRLRAASLRWAENFGLRRVRRGAGRLAETHGEPIFAVALAARARRARRRARPLSRKGSCDVTGPLSGLRVVELGGIGPAPFAGALLGDLGADILRIDRIPKAGVEPETPARFDFYNRNKCSVALDLKRPAAIEAVLAAVAKADALIEGFRPGVMERLGLGPDVCLAANPRLVFARMTGWGQEGPLAQEAGHDINYLALTGALHALGDADRPPPPPLNLVADLGGGALYLTVGVLSAVIHARETGRGQTLDVAMVDGVTHLMSAFQAFRQQGVWTGPADRQHRRRRRAILSLL